MTTPIVSYTLKYYSASLVDPGVMDSYHSYSLNIFFKVEEITICIMIYLASS